MRSYTYIHTYMYLHVHVHLHVYFYAGSLLPAEHTSFYYLNSGYDFICTVHVKFTINLHNNIVPLQQIKSMQTRYQFLLISSPPAKEVVFQQAKQKHGSTYAFQ